MAFEKELNLRSNSCCELCSSTTNLESYEILPLQNNGKIDDYVLICEKCKNQLENTNSTDTNHWRCLNDSMWSEIPAVKVLVYRILHLIKNETWPQDLLDMLYLDDETLSWAQANGTGKEEEDLIIHKDSNGVKLEAGDTVVLIKDLNVKGGGFTAKRGTAVRNIRLVHDNPEHIEGKVEGQTIVILTQYVKK